MKSSNAWIVLSLALALSFVIALAAFAQPPIPHPAQVGNVSYKDRVACHRTGENNATIMPDDHARRKNLTAFCANVQAIHRISQHTEAH
jgi:hypothetical protein